MADLGKRLPAKLNENFVSRAAFFLISSTIVWTTLFYGTVHQPLISFFYIVVAVIGVFWLIEPFFTGFFRFDSNPVQFTLAASALYGVIQLIPFGSLPVTGGVEGIPRTISYDPFETQVAAVHIAALFLFLAAATAFTDGKKRLMALVRLITVFGSAYAFYAILQLFLSPKKIYGIYSSVSIYAIPFGSFVNRNNYAGYIEMTIALPAGLLFAGAISKDKRLLYLTGIGIMGVSLLLSGSRGGLVAIIAGICFLAIVTRSKKGARGLAVRIVALAILVAAVVGGTWMIGRDTSLTRIADTAASKNMTISRTEIWSTSLRIVGKSFPFGAGMGAFGAAYSEFDRFNGLERVEQAHNDYLEVLATTGIFGTAIGLIFIILLFRSGFQGLRARDPFVHGAAAGALAGCFAVLVHSLFDFVLHTTAISVLFLSLVAIIAACARLARAEIAMERGERADWNVTPMSVEESA